MNFLIWFHSEELILLYLLCFSLFRVPSRCQYLNINTFEISGKHFCDVALSNKVSNSWEMSSDGLFVLSLLNQNFGLSMTFFQDWLTNLHFIVPSFDKYWKILSPMCGTASRFAILFLKWKKEVFALIFILSNFCKRLISFMKIWITLLRDDEFSNAQWLYVKKKCSQLFGVILIWYNGSNIFYLEK